MPPRDDGGGATLPCVTGGGVMLPRGDDGVMPSRGGGGAMPPVPAATVRCRCAVTTVRCRHSKERQAAGWEHFPTESWERKKMHESRVSS
jgi:hypothetical protein